MKCVETKEQKEQGHYVPWYLALPNLRVLAPLCGNDPNSVMKLKYMYYSLTSM